MRVARQRVIPTGFAALQSCRDIVVGRRNRGASSDRRVASSRKLLTTISGCDVRHRHFALAGKIRRACDQLLYLHGDATPFCRRQRRNEAGRKHTIKYDMLGWAAVAVQKTRFGKRRKASSWKYLSPLLRVK